MYSPELIVYWLDDHKGRNQIAKKCMKKYHISYFTKRYSSESFQVYSHTFGGSSEYFPVCSEVDFNMANDLFDHGSIDLYRAGRIRDTGKVDWYFRGDVFGIVITSLSFYGVNISNNSLESFLGLRVKLKESGQLPLVDLFWGDFSKVVSNYPHYMSPEKFSFLDLLRRRVLARWWHVGLLYPK